MAIAADGPEASCLSALRVFQLAVDEVRPLLDERQLAVVERALAAAWCRCGLRGSTPLALRHLRPLTAAARIPGSRHAASSDQVRPDATRNQRFVTKMHSCVGQGAPRPWIGRQPALN